MSNKRNITEGERPGRNSASSNAARGREVTIADMADMVEKRRAELGLDRLPLPVNQGHRRTESKKALLRALRALWREKGVPGFEASIRNLDEEEPSERLSVADDSGQATQDVDHSGSPRSPNTRTR